MCWDSSSSSIFQSTLSVRRATRLMLMAWLRLDISIHALRKESDSYFLSLPVGIPVRFQSTLSVRRATLVLRENLHRPGISIHALRKESDASSRSGSAGAPNFNPRSP